MAQLIHGTGQGVEGLPGDQLTWGGNAVFLPGFSLTDQNGRTREFANLKGPKGLVLVFFRSADW